MFELQLAAALEKDRIPTTAVVPSGPQLRVAQPAGQPSTAVAHSRGLLLSAPVLGREIIPELGSLSEGPQESWPSSQRQQHVQGTNFIIRLKYLHHEVC